MIDLHAHLLPAIDDGARTTDQALGVLGAFARAGVQGVVCTPHLRASMIVSGRHEALIEERDRKLAALRAVGDELPRLYAGFEIMLDEPLTGDALADPRLSLAGSRYLLVEFPHSVVPEFATEILRRMRQQGAVPLVAHPERYASCSPAVVEAWRNAGALMQVDATTLTRTSARGRKARALLAAGLGDVLAADNHGDSRVLSRAAAFITDRGGRGADDAAHRLTTTNPRAIVRNEDVDPAPAVRLDERLLERLKRLLKG